MSPWTVNYWTQDEQQDGQQDEQQDETLTSKPSYNDNNSKKLFGVVCTTRCSWSLNFLATLLTMSNE